MVDLGEQLHFEEQISEFRIDDVCVGMPSSFFNLTQHGVDYFWDFGNGDTSNLKHPPDVIYQAARYSNKLYIITLTVKNECNTSIFKDTIVVFPFPVADFELEPDIDCEPLKVTLRNKSYGLPKSIFLKKRCGLDLKSL